MNNLKKKIFGLSLSILLIITLASCGGKSKQYDNENTPLILSSEAFDGVFNPFYSTSGSDSNAIGLTQLGMLTNDKNGDIVCGDEYATVVKEYEEVTTGTKKDVDLQTTYYFVLKNNVKFSNGSALTIKDVIFNMYEFLDPAYTGSTTMYSTDIVGLKEYRTQESSSKEQDEFMNQFEKIADTRIDLLISFCEDVFDDNSNKIYTSNEEFRLDLESYVTDMIDELEDYYDRDYKSEEEKKEALKKFEAEKKEYNNVLVDYDKAIELFKEELSNDYNNNVDTYKDISFTDSKGKKYENLLTTDVEAFLYAEGYLYWVKKDGKLYSDLENDVLKLKNYTKEMAIEKVLADMVPNKIVQIVSYWATATDLREYLTNLAMEEFFHSGNNDRKYKNISGIKFANMEESVTVNGKEYAKASYDEAGNLLSDSYEVLSVTINNVDPKAIYNFSFSVAPMYYYSDEEHIKKFDFVENFGVEYASQSFQSNVIKMESKIGVPVGAGPYQAAKSSGGINPSSGEFFDNNVLYYERNPYYLLGSPIIKMVRYQVSNTNNMLNSLYTGELDYVQPNAKQETIDELKTKTSKGISYATSETNGYGYIGINASKVTSMKVRQAIMHSINTQDTVSYYKGTAQALYRSMSLTSWVYKKSTALSNATSYYPFIGGEIPADLSLVNPDYQAFVEAKGKKAGEKFTVDEQIEFITGLVESAGFTKDGNGIYTKGSEKLKMTFTIAGETTDHPAYQALSSAGAILNKCGFEITTSTDANALKKLSTGALTVWAAAWSATIDPDMYQVYHMDSTATSVKNWGYDAIKANPVKYAEEYELLVELSDLIDQGRETTDQVQRASIYSQCLDLVMQLAIELPTYQRDDLYVYNANKIDESTLNQDISPYTGLLSNLEKVSLLVK